MGADGDGTDRPSTRRAVSTRRDRHRRDLRNGTIEIDAGDVKAPGVRVADLAAHPRVIGEPRRAVRADEHLLSAGAGGDLGADEDDFGASGPSGREKKPALAGAGKRGDMDDEIPF